LRQMWTRVQHASFVEPLGTEAFLSPEPARRGVETYPGQQIGDRLRIAGGAEQPLNASSGERWEEIVKVHALDDSLSDMRPGEGSNGAALAEAMYRLVIWDAAEDLAEHLLLQPLQARLWYLDQADGATRFSQHAVVVMMKLRGRVRPGRGIAVKSLAIGKPLNLPDRQAEPAGQRRNCLYCWKRPRARRRNGLHLLRLGGPLRQPQLGSMALASALEKFVVLKEPDDRAQPGPRLPRKDFVVPRGER